MTEKGPDRKFEATPWLSTACIRDIFLHTEERHKKRLIENFKQSRVQNDNNCTEYLKVYPNMTEIRPKNTMKNTNFKRGGGRKKEITEFSRKSRRNFIKFLCKISEPVELWQDFTFADDIMTGKTTSQRRDISNKALNRFRRVIKNKYPSMWAIYKREWQSRKSGNLSGEYIPHFHMFIVEKNKSENFNYMLLALDLALIWVQCTKTAEFEKALRVARHPRSYRLIENQKHAMFYASKYVVKADEFKTDESIGRSWGTIGNIKTENPKIVELTYDEAVHYKRVARKTLHKRNKGLKKSLSNPEIPTFIIIKEETTDRIMKYVGDTLEWECLSFFAEVA